MDENNGFYSALQLFTERALSARKKKRLAARLKQQSKHWLRDWLEAILWAVCMVLLINQYLFQMYRIPSGSMSGTLEIGDMIFVNKLVYGPELLPGIAKLPGFRKPERGEVVVFENPAYLGKGPVFTIMQQFIYMATLTMVDIDRDENGDPRVHYLIKRAVGVGGDTMRIIDGDMEFRFRGSGEWLPEASFLASGGGSYPIRRLVAQADYKGIEQAGVNAAYLDMGISPSGVSANTAIYDEFAFSGARLGTLADAYPHQLRFVHEERKLRQGWYIPEGRVFTLGDNRDNSRDARWYGAVSNKKVLGHALFIYWPLGRMGSIR
jgi:signal peptidase I